MRGEILPSLLGKTAQIKAGDNMMLSKYFSYAEATRSVNAEAIGMKNDPPPIMLENLKYFLTNYMDKVRELFGKPIVANSIYRNPAVNKLVGGSKTSVHMQGLAADFPVNGYSPRQAIGEIVRSGIEFDQLIDEYGTWVHFGIRRDKPNRKQVLVYRRLPDGSTARTVIKLEDAKRW